jgi:mycothiol maleylpyruvate isomerase-like protein
MSMVTLAGDLPMTWEAMNIEQTGRAAGGVVTNAGDQAGVGQVHPVAEAGTRHAAATPRQQGGHGMPPVMAALGSDLGAENAVTRNLVAGLDEAGRRTQTPAAGWDIADQIGHLAYSYEAAVRAAVRPGEFRAALAGAQAVSGADTDNIARSRDRS